MTSPFVLKLYFSVFGVEYLVAETPSLASNLGHHQFDLDLPVALTIPYVDGVAWDGRFRIEKSGTINGFLGLIMIDYM